MRTDKGNKEQKAFLFNVDLLVQGETNAIAMENLLHALNQCNLDDFRILSGVQLGQIIAALEEAQVNTKQPADKPRAVKSEEEAPPVKASKPSGNADKKEHTTPIIDQPLITDSIKICIAENRLIRLTDKNGLLTVYHVDEKQVYSFTLNEIDDLLLN
ncbi:hypothetical protein D3C85_1366290 [compost metagenome]